MCNPVMCNAPGCGRTTWKGCGGHIDDSFARAGITDLKERCPHNFRSMAERWHTYVHANATPQTSVAMDQLQIQYDHLISAGVQPQAIQPMFLTQKPLAPLSQQKPANQFVMVSAGNSPVPIPISTTSTSLKRSTRHHGHRRRSSTPKPFVAGVTEEADTNHHNPQVVPNQVSQASWGPISSNQNNFLQAASKFFLTS